jgi:hypothetical protein
MIPSQLQRLSALQAPAGAGKSLLQNNTITQLGVPIVLGRSPGPGTNCSFFLNTLKDNLAWMNAQVDFIAVQNGREVVFDTQFITNEVLATNRNAISLSTGSCAADYWEVQITLTNGHLPQVNPTQSSIVATGVERFNDADAIPGSLTFSAVATGPGASGMATFPLPPGTSTWQVTGIARVLTPGGGSEAAGDSYSVSAPGTWNLKGSVARLIPATAGAPFVSTDADMSTTTFVNGSFGANASVTYTLPAGLDAGTTVEVTITLIPLAKG